MSTKSQVHFRFPEQLPATVFSNRRRAVREQLGDDAVLLVFSGRAPLRSNDVHYRFRPGSDFYYLTGFEEEACALALTRDSEVLFLQPRDPEHEIWYGYRLGVERAPEVLGVERALDYAEFSTELPGLLHNKDELYYQYGRDADQDRVVFGAVNAALGRARRGAYAPTRVTHPTHLLHEMRMRKSPEEVEVLRRCAAVTGRAHRRAMDGARPGVFEHELEAAILHEFRLAGGQEGYPSIVAGGANACILHYIENNRPIADGALVLIDAGVELHYLNADVTRTFPVSGRFSAPQRAVYDVVLEAQQRAIARLTVGSSMAAVHNATIRDLTAGMLELGLLATDHSVDAHIEQENYKRFFMHGTGHWLGVDVHDVGTYYHRGTPRALAPGMVSTVEPGIYIAPNAEDVPEELRGIGIRIEDDILITANGPENLTHEIPKLPAAVEELVGAAVFA